MKHLLFLIVSGLFIKDSFSFPFPSSINGLKKKKPEYLSLEKQNKKEHLSLETWYLMGKSIYIKNRFMITRIKKPAICRTVKSEQNFTLQITVWYGTPWKYLGKEENSLLFWFAFCCCDNTVAKRNLGTKEFIQSFKSQVILHPWGQGGTRGRNRMQRPQENAAFLTCLLFGFCSSLFLMQPGPPD